MSNHAIDRPIASELRSPAPAGHRECLEFHADPKSLLAEALEKHVVPMAMDSG
jgi:hypothetical protein